jgi:hypothetical protein
VSVFLAPALLEMRLARFRDELRVGLSALLSLTLIVFPVCGSPTAILGTVVSAERARVGRAAASVGTTVFNGDQLDTEQTGSIQVRAAAARLLLSGSSRVTWHTDEGAPSATLTAGTATFSTVNSKAFTLLVATAAIRPQGNEPTVGNVTVLNPKELTVRCTRGVLTISVGEDTREIPEGLAYHVVLDPDAAASASAAASDNTGPAGQKQPRRTGKSMFIWFVIGVTALATAIAVHEALESPDRP